MITKKPLIDKNVIISDVKAAETKAETQLERNYGDKPCCVEDFLCRQIDHEFGNESLYLAMSIWCTNNGYYETAKFFNAQSTEERSHGISFINFMAKRGMTVHTPKYEVVATDFSNIKDVMEKSLVREIETTKMISEIHQEAMKTSDVTMVIADEFLKEQMEEEQLFISLNNLVDMCNGNKIDFEMEIHALVGGKYKVGEV